MSSRFIIQSIVMIGVLSIVTSCVNTPSQKIDPPVKEITPSSMANIMNNADTASCESRSTQESKDQCLDNIALMQAKTNNDPVTCASIKSKDILGMCLAATKKIDAPKNTDSCAGIIDAETKKSCISTQQMTVALTAMDIALCEQVQDIDQQKNCRSTILFSQAVSKKDNSLCLKLEDKNQQKSCKESIK